MYIIINDYRIDIINSVSMYLADNNLQEFFFDTSLPQNNFEELLNLIAAISIKNCNIDLYDSNDYKIKTFTNVSLSRIEEHISDDNHTSSLCFSKKCDDEESE